MLQSRRGFIGVAAATAASLALPNPLLAATGPRSRLPWLSGVCSWDVPTFEGWRKRRLDLLITFTTYDNLYQFYRPGRSVTLLGKYLDRPERLVVSLPMFPRTGGPFPAKDSSQWAGIAKGNFDDSWRTQISYLRGITSKNDIIFRPGWEWGGGGSFPWVIHDPGQAENYKTSYRRYVKIIKEYFPSSKIDWTSSRVPQADAHIDAFYPGGDVIDYIGHHHYDRDPASRTKAQFNANAQEKGKAGPEGIQAWLDYCKSKRKPMSLPEWGLWSTDKAGGGDNPAFIQYMYNFLKKNRNSIAYEAYFNMNGVAQHTLGPDEELVDRQTCVDGRNCYKSRA